MNKIIDVVVTFNRKTLLEECIQALINQTYTDHDILIIDNASTDQTFEYISPYLSNRIKYINTGKNLGGAGGFSLGYKIAVENGYDYAWIMDDDSIPDPGALASIVHKIEAIQYEFSFISSLVRWTDGSIFPMNVPHVVEDIGNQIEFLVTNQLLRVKSGSFVGCFTNLNVVEQVGLPISEFFIYGDDSEYTRRLSKIKPAFWDTDSLIIHKAPSISGADIVTATPDRLSRFFFQHRNAMYIARKRGITGVIQRLKLHTKRIINVIKHAPDHKIARIWVILKGTTSGFFFNPKIQFAARK